MYALLALVQERLGHHEAAKDWLEKGRSMVGHSSRDAFSVPIGHPLLAEAEEVILDRSFPANPFVK